MGKYLSEFDWNCARGFLATAELGSLSAAAKALGLSQPTLSRQVSQLESTLGVALFERVGKGLELTPIGIELLEFAQKMGEGASKLSIAASGHSELLEGEICISATEFMSVFLLPPLIQQLRQQEPQIKLVLVASNKVSDIKRREADIALRTFRPSQGDLIVKRLRDMPYNLYATEEYLASIGHPKQKKDFAHAQFVGFDSSARFMNILNAQGFKLSSANFALNTENNAANWAMVKQGLGIGVMIEEAASADPSVKKVLESLEFPVAENWLVTHRELRTNRRVKRVFDFFAGALSEGEVSL